MQPPGGRPPRRGVQLVLKLKDLNPLDFLFHYAADKIYLADDPAGHKVEASLCAARLRTTTAQTAFSFKGL